MKVTDVSTNEYNSYYQAYIDKVPTQLNLIEGLVEGRAQVLTYFRSQSTDRLNFSYASGKWTIKEIFQHIIDTERVLYYRLFSIARQDKTNLPGFEQDDYVLASNAQFKSIEDLVEAYEAVRLNSLVLVKKLTETDFKTLGHVSGGNMSARAAAFIIVGHEQHHLQVLQDRYI